MDKLFIVLLVVSSVIIIVASLIMEPKTEGMGSLSGAETNVFGKYASRGREQILQRLMVISAIVFMISAIMISVLSK